VCLDDGWEERLDRYTDLLVFGFSSNAGSSSGFFAARTADGPIHVDIQIPLSVHPRLALTLREPLTRPA
jgi:hypothetical protein